MRKLMQGPQRPGKRCGKCDEWKPAAAFYKASCAKDGLQYRCKACMNAAKRDYYRQYYNDVIKVRRNERRAEAVQKMQRVAAGRRVPAV